MKRMVLTCVVVALSGCAMQPKVAPADGRLMKSLATETSGYIASRFPVASTTIQVDEGSQPELTRAVGDSLLRQGFAVAVPGVNTAGARRIRVQSVNLSNGDVLLQVTLDAATASRLYTKRADGSVQAASVFTVASRSQSAIAQPAAK